MSGDRIDGLARIVATPMPRRRVLRLGIGALAGATVAPATLAPGAFGQRPRPRNCQEYCSSGTPCEAARPSCCCVDSSEQAGAWVVPVGGACYNEAVYKCCPVKRPDGTQSVVYCDARNERCGPGGEGNFCECLIPCGNPEVCCPPDSECRDGRCYQKCPPEWTGSGAVCCPPGTLPNAANTACRCAEGQKCKGDGCCPFGYVCGDSEVLYYGEGIPQGVEERRVCVGPPDASGKWDSTLAYPFFPKAGFGTNAAPRAFTPRAVARAAAVPPFALTLSAVAGQGAAALAAWATPRLDRRFRTRVRAPRVRITVTGLSGEALSTTTALLTAEAKANAQLLAAGRARSRSLGAIAAGDGRRAKQHSRDSGRLAGKAAAGYRTLPGRRAAAAAALRAAGVGEIVVTAEQLAASRASLAAALPADLAGELARLGLTATERARVKERLVLASASAAAGAVLIEPLEDVLGAQRFDELARDLRRYAGSVRREPLTSTTDRPRGIPRPIAGEPS